MNIDIAINFIDSQLNQTIGTNQCVTDISKLGDLYAKYFRKDHIDTIDNYDYSNYDDGRYDENPFVEHGSLSLQEDLLTDLKSNLVGFVNDDVYDVYPYIFSDREFLTGFDNCCQIHRSGGRGNCDNDHEYAAVYLFKNIKIAIITRDYASARMYIEDESFINMYGDINMDVFNKYYDKFNDHFDELTLVDFIFGVYEIVKFNSSGYMERYYRTENDPNIITFKKPQELYDYINEFSDGESNEESNE